MRGGAALGIMQPASSKGNVMSSNSFKQHMLEHFSTNPSAYFYEAERRSWLQVELPFPALVRGLDSNNRPFEEHTVLHSLSAHGLSMRLLHRVARGTCLFLVVRLGINESAPAARIALRGLVEGVEPNSDGSDTIALVFTRYRFLYANSQ
jgi:hypothetical protein